MIPLSPIFKKAYWAFAGVGAAYAVFLLCLLHPTVQKHAIYVHKIHSGYFTDVTRPELFGFAKNQAKPFYIKTPDGENLFAWHLLPIGLYAKHEEELLAEPIGLAEDVTKTKGFRLLTDDPESRLIILFHGNAGHVVEGWRPDSLRALSSGSSSNTHTHVLIFDYRGFGSSSGDPSEAGLIADGIAAVSWALEVAKIPSSRIVLLGQSLGTAVASAVALHFASGPSGLSEASLLPEKLLPATAGNTENKEEIVITKPSTPLDFAGIVLVAPFTNLPHLVLSYRIKGIIPILSPLRPYPYLQSFLTRHIVDKWDSAARIRELVRVTREEGNGGGGEGRRFRLQIVHARDDVEINSKDGEALYQIAVEAEGGKYEARELKRGEGRVEVYRGKKGVGDREIRLDLVESGGHNRIVSYSPVSLAVIRAFGLHAR